MPNRHVRFSVLFVLVIALAVLLGIGSGLLTGKVQGEAAKVKEAKAKQYKYVIVRSDGDADELPPVVQKSGARVSIPELLKDGWVPVRESRFAGQTADPRILILFQKDNK